MKISESLRHELFDAQTGRDLGHALRDGNPEVRQNSISFFIAAIASGISFHFQARTILIFAEDIRDKRVELFPAAMAQGEFRCFNGILTLEDSQRGFGTRYLKPRSSLHLNTH